MSGPVIRDAMPGDAVVLAGILGDWIRETGWMPVLHDREEDLAFVSGLIKGQTCRVAEGGAGPTGFLARRGGHVDTLYLTSEARGRGIGTGLVDEVKLVEPEIDLWTFQANGGAIAFYQRLGFVVVEETDGRRNDERLPDVRLMWRRGP